MQNTSTTNKVRPVAEKIESMFDRVTADKLRLDHLYGLTSAIEYDWHYRLTKSVSTETKRVPCNLPAIVFLRDNCVCYKYYELDIDCELVKKLTIHVSAILANEQIEPEESRDIDECIARTPSMLLTVENIDEKLLSETFKKNIEWFDKLDLKYLIQKKIEEMNVQILLTKIENL